MKRFENPNPSPGGTSLRVPELSEVLNLYSVDVARIMEGRCQRGSNRLKAINEAKGAMPEPPRGCNVCHYLYDI